MAVVNQKGGVGKTTTCANLGIGLAQEEKRVLLVDSDPQGSLTISLGFTEPDKLPFTLATAMSRVVEDQEILPGEGILHHAENVDLVPANIELAGMEVSLINAMSREKILKQYLEPLKRDYDYILIFDVSDTGGGANARRPFLWEYRPEHQESVGTVLEERFGSPGRASLALQLEAIAGDLIENWWEDHRQDILGIVDGSFLEEYDEGNLRAAFHHVGTVSTAYMLMSRCGIDPSSYFTHEDFLQVFDFNPPETIGALGSAISEASEQVLRQIEVTIKRYEREHRAERTESYERTAIQDERRLPDSRPEPERDDGNAAGQVRENAENLSEGASSGTVLESASVGEAVSASEEDRRGGAEPSGNDDPEADGSSGNQREAESREPDAVGRPDEQLQSPGGGDDSLGAGLQLNDASEGPGQMSLFPSEAEQIEQIAEAESVQETLPAFSVPQEDIDLLLIYGSNDRNGRMMIATEFMKQKSVGEIAAFLKKTYRVAYGIETERGQFSSFAAEEGT